ncbi:MAG: YbhB/YbcL family Raf kinase inhibitor-like protein [Candidatus Bathyarchaeota archaeon]|nr:YbhB/YbcL family Raf kinase inhibitor-like protein [Candidatus Bathyarchaeum sp.]
MKLTSENFVDKGSIPSEFTCDGKNISPQLSWTEIPEQTKSFALTSTDPDAPGGMWIHWLVYDIPKQIQDVEKNSLPAGAKEIENDFGKKPYGGPCPPSGTHRYFFTIYALDVEHLDSVNKRNFLDKVKQHTIEKVTIMGLYKRQR